VPFTKPSGIKYVLTIYDLIPLIYPKNYPPGVRGWINWQINKYLIKKNIDAVITISETSKKDICRFIGLAPEKVFVTYLSSPPVFKKLKKGGWEKEIMEKYNLPQKFVLYVGDINYNKNIPNLVKACTKGNINLVIAGKQAADLENMDLNHAELVHLKNLNTEKLIRVGFVEDEDLVKIYNLAEVYVHPSFYEGFGLPPLQAVACGTPVSISKNQCHVEIFGNGCEYFDPSNVHEIISSINHPNKDVSLPRDYSWVKTARATVEVYEKI
jgi:glycosyltransferase involved in cell wall biosynthesis